jgi:hypothetical protein
MPTLLPRDSDNNIIPAVRLKAGGAHSIAATASSARTGPFNADTRIVSLYATSPVYIKFGDSTVTATTADHYFPSGVYYDFAIGGGAVPQYGYIAALRVSADGTLYVSEKE